MAFLQHRNIFFARYMKGKLYLNLKCKIESWLDSLQVFLTSTSSLKSLLTSTSQESAHNLSERTSSVDLPVWKSLHVSLITWLHFPMPMEKCHVNCFHRTSITTQTNSSTARLSTISVPLLGANLFVSVLATDREKKWLSEE